MTDDDIICLCGGQLMAKPDEQYGTVWECKRCGQRYATES